MTEPSCGMPQQQLEITMPDHLTYLVVYFVCLMALSFASSKESK
tara:strand:+ start:302 stop:433 length:132 start_codon:yes stop_codon:yes gene_type:complete